MSAPTKRQKPRTATHRPAKRHRRFKHDDSTAVDLLSGFGGFTKGAEIAGFTTIVAANHSEYKIDVHEANHPDAEHWIADLVDTESADYHSVRDLPAADLLLAGVSCVNHSQANTQKAYEQGLTLFELDDPEFDQRVTRSEKDRATANCVLHYAQKHRPRLILIECTTELTSWGPAIPDKPKIGDGSTYRWWLNQFGIEGYEYKVLYLNSQFFGVPQSRDRLYIGFWLRHLPAPDLEHRPLTHCVSCDDEVEAVWSWKTGVPPSGSVRYGIQYNYRCPRCRREVVPPMTPSLHALDLTTLGARIGDKPLKTFKVGDLEVRSPLAPATMARIERCRKRFAEFPAVLMPAKSVHGSERHPWQPLATQTSQQETALLSTGSALWAAVNNFQGAPRHLGEPLPTTLASETLGLVAGVIPFRKNTTPTLGREPMPTITSEQIPGLLTAEWSAALAELPVEDCFFRMLGPHEVGRGCGFDTTFPDRPGEFIVWGSARNQCDGFGNAVSPAVGAWIGERLRAVLHTAEAIA